MWAPWLPVAEMVRHLADNYPDEMLGYLRVFYKQETTTAAFRQRAAAIELTVDDAVAALDAAGIARCLITGFDERASCGKVVMPNEIVASVAGRHPDRFIPFAGADVLRGLPAVRELEHWVRERGFRGLSLRPFMIWLPADSRHSQPLYAHGAEP